MPDSLDNALQEGRARDSHRQNATASYQVTDSTGWCSSTSAETPSQAYGRWPGSKTAYCALVTATAAIRNGAVISTRWRGCSSSSPSPSGLPIRNSPGGISRHSSIFPSRGVSTHRKRSSGGAGVGLEHRGGFLGARGSTAAFGATEPAGEELAPLSAVEGQQLEHQEAAAEAAVADRPRGHDHRRLRPPLGDGAQGLFGLASHLARHLVEAVEEQQQAALLA